MGVKGSAAVVVACPKPVSSRPAAVMARDSFAIVANQVGRAAAQVIGEAGYLFKVGMYVCRYRFTGRRSILSLDEGIAEFG
jgi:hypothetical protein